MVTFREGRESQKLETLQREEAEELTRILSSKYKIPYINLSRVSIDLDYLKIVPEEEARRIGIAVFQGTGKKLKVAVKNPTIPELQSVLGRLEDNGYVCELLLASLPSLERAWSRYSEIRKGSRVTAGIIDVSEERIREFGDKVLTISDLDKLLSSRTSHKVDAQASEVLEIILSGGFKLDASDVHIEPQEGKVVIRLRLDGVLHEAATITHELFKLIVSRIKLISEMKLNVKDRPQDGRFTIRAHSTDVEIRASTLPGYFGESIVLRYLNPKTISMKLEDLGMQTPLFKLMEKEIRRANGMVLTTGPTGSGKTTTLYAFIKKINSPDVKIITLENPIEYHIEDITQTQVDPAGEYTFARGLTAILRQDPDIILVGEIRDLETAEAAMHAALTGHLVFSTLHTNDAAGTVPRLIDIGVKPNIISPAINVAMAQRLLRKLCVHCRKSDALTDKEKILYKKDLEEIPAEYIKPDISRSTVYRENGCKECNMLGYKGRIGIFEAFVIDDTIERLILQNPSESDIKEAARVQGMLTLKQDGILKVLSGITSPEELERVMGEE